MKKIDSLIEKPSMADDELDSPITNQELDDLMVDQESAHLIADRELARLAVKNNPTLAPDSPYRPKARGVYDFDLTDSQYQEIIKQAETIRQQIHQRAIKLFPLSDKLTNHLRVADNNETLHQPLSLFNHKDVPSLLNSLLIVKRFLDKRAIFLTVASERPLLPELSAYVNDLIHQQY